MHCDFCQKQGHLEDKCCKMHGKADWVDKKEVAPDVNASFTSLAADSCASSASASVTLSHDNFQHLLQMTHADSSFLLLVLQQVHLISLCLLIVKG